MKTYSKISISHCLVLIMLPLAIANVFLNGKLTQEFSLIPIKVINYLELWRLITFPFSGGSIETILLFALTFYFVAPKLEQILNKSLYLLLLFLLICLQGTLQTLIFWKSELAFAGAGGISFFVLTLYALLNLNKSITFWRYKPINSLFVSFVFTFIWIIGLLIHTSFTFQREVYITNFPDLVFGLIAGGLTYIQIIFAKKVISDDKVKNEPLSKLMPSPPIEDDSEMDFALVDKEGKIEQNSIPRYDLPTYDEKEMVFTEDKLNQILDKISEQGKNSLTLSELLYLKEYSKTL